MSIRQNTLYNFLGSVTPLVISLITVPLYLQIIGTSRYGILVIVWLFLGYFSFLDLGLGRAIAQRIARLHTASNDRRAQVFWTALSVNAGIGIVGSFIVWPTADYLFGYAFHMSPVLRSEISDAIPWLVLAIPIITLSSVLTGSLQGREAFLKLNIATAIGTTLVQTLPLLVAIFWGIKLELLLLAVLVARLVTLFILYSFCNNIIILGHRPSFSKKEALRLLRFGGWVSTTAILWPLMAALDRLVIGTLIGVKMVSYYAIPFQLAQRSTIVSQAFVSAIFPRLSAISSLEEQRLANRGFNLVLITITPVYITGVVLMKPFLTLWISAEFADNSALVGQIVLAGYWFNSLARIPYAQLQARERPDIIAKIHLAEILPYLGLLYLGVSEFGLIGAAVVFSTRVILNFFLLAWFSGILQKQIYSLAIPITLLSGGVFLEQLPTALQTYRTTGLAALFGMTATWGILKFIAAWHKKNERHE